MDEAAARPEFHSPKRRRARKRKQRGQAIVEYLLLLGITVFFARFIFFDPEYGLFGIINKGMLRVGTHLEQNLKSGTQPGGPGTGSTDQFAGASSWKN